MKHFFLVLFGILILNMMLNYQISNTCSVQPSTTTQARSVTGITLPNETPNGTPGPDACPAPTCGNGVIDTGETCDDGASNSDTNADACRTNCRPATCGDGVIDTDETCDDGASNSDTNADACRRDCTPATCGDGVIDTGETCDDGPLNSDTSTAPSCGLDCAPADCQFSTKSPFGLNDDEASYPSELTCSGGLCNIAPGTTAVLGSANRDEICDEEGLGFFGTSVTAQHAIEGGIIH